ncbi:hypothetical protein FB107DRAFT_280432 [Schizophyllum commune]
MPLAGMLPGSSSSGSDLSSACDVSKTHGQREALPCNPLDFIDSIVYPPLYASPRHVLALSPPPQYYFYDENPRAAMSFDFELGMNWVGAPICAHGQVPTATSTTPTTVARALQYALRGELDSA